MMRALCMLALFATPAWADDEWARGVSAEAQAKANALFAEGNELFAQQAHAAALAKYRAAVALWDHPKIRLNIAVSEIRLDRYLEAADDLDAALRFGQAPFSLELYNQALDYQKLIAGRVGSIEASCDQPGTAISLDGKPWFMGPGKQAVRVLSGEHVLAGDRAGFMPRSLHVVVSGAKTTSEHIELMPLDAVVTFEYPSPRWLPWTVAGGGAAIALGGLALWFSARSQYDDANAQISEQNGAAEGDPLVAKVNGAIAKNRVAIGVMVGGGAIAVTGIVWTVLNRPRRVLPSMEMVPTAGGAAARVTWRF